MRMRLALLSLLSLSAYLLAQDAEVTNKLRMETPRSMVVSRYGIVAANQPMAARAGTLILERGGNAIDAIIATDAALGVVEPVVGGIGGDLFAIIYEAKSKKLYGINASGWAAAGHTVEYLASKGVKDKIPAKNVFGVTLPGAVAGWDAMVKRFGTKPLSELLAPAIFYAEEGFPVSESIAFGWRMRAPKTYAGVPGFAETYLPNGKGPEPGDIFRNQPLAESLKRIAKQGREGFYKGKTAESLISFLNGLGGKWTPEDFSSFEAEWVTPITTTYRGWALSEMPPNGQGIGALMMLNMMEQFPIKEYGHNSTKALHVMIEARKLAQADLAAYIGDPRYHQVPTDALKSKENGIKRAKLIHAEHAVCAPPASDITAIMSRLSRDTTYLTAIDQEGNIVSFIRSNSSGFGTGLVAPGTGFSLHNRGETGFTLLPGKANTIAGRHRPFHTIIPAFLEKGDIKIGFGIMGGANQPQAHAQFVSNVIDHGMNIQEALAAARFRHMTMGKCDVNIETRVSSKVIQELKAMGHEMKETGSYNPGMGMGHAVMLDGKGVKYAAADPRWDGEAVPQGPPVFRK